MKRVTTPIGMEIANFRPVNTFITTDEIDGKDTIRVTKDPKVTAVDEATFAKLIDSDFKNGILEVKGEKAKLYLNGQEHPVLIVNDLKHGANASGGVGLWVDIGTEGHFADLRVENS